MFYMLLACQTPYIATPRSLTISQLSNWPEIMSDVQYR